MGVVLLECVNMVTLKHNGNILAVVEFIIGGLAGGAIGIKIAKK